MQRRLKAQQKWQERSPRTSAEEAASLWWLQEPRCRWGRGWESVGASVQRVLHSWTLLKSAPSRGPASIYSATAFISCGASVDTIVLFFSSLRCARPSLERELCYYLRKSGSGLTVWFEGKISCVSFLLVIFWNYIYLLVLNLWVDIEVRPSLRKPDILNYIKKRWI